jgi:hypothetical protein
VDGDRRTHPRNKLHNLVPFPVNTAPNALVRSRRYVLLELDVDVGAGMTVRVLGGMRDASSGDGAELSGCGETDGRG